MELVEANEEFRWGVTAFHSGYFDKALLSFERSSALKPENILTQFWLGETYRRLGFEETALKIWSRIEESGNADHLLINRIDSLNFKRGLGQELSETGTYIPSYQIKGSFDTYSLFERPASAAVMEDGSYFLTSFTTNEVLHMNVNGGIHERIQGGLQGFDHPFGIALNSGYLFVTEFEADRIARVEVTSGSIMRFGRPGRGAGQLSGPQFIAADDAGYLYVSEIGNRRVSKFDKEGNFLFSFGTRTSEFSGMKGPSGILIHNRHVYVNDNREGCVWVFDESGNFLYSLGKGILSHPEGLSLYDAGSLLIADTSRIFRLDVNSRKFSVLHEFNDKNVRVLSAAMDANRNLMALDFNGNMVHFLTEVNELYSGLSVDIVSIQASRYPRVQVMVKVQNRMGEPFTGLERANFLITEAQTGITEYSMVYTGQHSSDKGYSLIVEKSADLSGNLTEVKEAAEILVDGFGTPVYSSLVGAAEKAVLMADNRLSAGNVSNAVYDTEGTGRTWDVDGSIILAASGLVNKPFRKSLVMITGGVLPPDSFDEYSLLQLGNYLVNNDICFSVVYIREMNQPPRELEYLVQKTNGQSRYLYQPDGIRGIVDTGNSVRSGLYVLEYESGADTDFGRRYLSVDVEASLFTRTGRDEKGYFAPAF